MYFEKGTVLQILRDYANNKMVCSYIRVNSLQQTACLAKGYARRMFLTVYLIILTWYQHRQRVCPDFATKQTPESTGIELTFKTPATVCSWQTHWWSATNGLMDERADWPYRQTNCYDIKGTFLQSEEIMLYHMNVIVKVSNLKNTTYRTPKMYDQLIMWLWSGLILYWT